MIKFRLFLVVFICTSLLAFIGLALSSNSDELIGNGDSTYDRWSSDNFDFHAYEGKLRKAINYYERALPLISHQFGQRKVHVLDRLTQAYFELAFAYLDDSSSKESAFAKGKDCALEALRLDPDFKITEEGEGLRDALSYSTGLVAVFFYGNNLGSYLDYHWVAALAGGMKEVLTAFERSLELDEEYLGAGPHRALASFLIKVPGFLGGNRETSKHHFERSIELGPDFLENYVDYAEYYAKQAVKDWDLFCQNLNIALDKAKDESVMKKWPLYNTLAVERAKKLFAFEYRGKRVCK